MPFPFEALLSFSYVINHILPSPLNLKRTLRTLFISIKFMWFSDFFIFFSLSRITSLPVPWLEETRMSVQTDPALIDTHCCKMARKTGEESVRIICTVKDKQSAFTLSPYSTVLRTGTQTTSYTEKCNETVIQVGIPSYGLNKIHQSRVRWHKNTCHHSNMASHTVHWAE